MPTKEFCNTILRNPGKIGKPLKWEDMSSMEKGTHIARVRRGQTPNSFGED